MKERIVLGIDGGGTSTRVALATEAGTLIAIGESGPGNYHDVGIDAVKANIRLALTRAWNLAGLPQRRAAAAFLGLASVASSRDRGVIRQLAHELGLADDQLTGVDHDLRIAMAGGLVGQPGIVLIVGTGSSCYGRSRNGDSWRAGGWGAVLDDAGSGGWLGLQSMIAAVRDYDGRGAPTVLTSRVMETLQLDDIQQILHRVDSERLSRKQTASLAPLVLDAAREGDAVAQDILRSGAEELAEMVAAVENRLDLSEQHSEVPVAVTGGIANAGAVVMDPLRAAIEHRVSQSVVVEPKLPPVLGGVLLAIDALGQPVTSEIVNNLQQTGSIC